MKLMISESLINLYKNNLSLNVKYFELKNFQVKIKRDGSVRWIELLEEN